MSCMEEFYQMLIRGSQAYARWDLETSTTILKSRKRMAVLFLLLLPILIGGIAIAAGDGSNLPEVLGGKKAYMPSHYTNLIFFASIFVGICAGLITGCIGAGGGFIIAPALMSAGVKGILAVGTDLFHIFAKAIMGSVLHKKLGNISIPLAGTFLIGSITGATLGGMLNRYIYDLNPILSDLFISSVYVLILGFLSFYALADYLKARKGETAKAKRSSRDEVIPPMGKRLQSVNLPPMLTFDKGVTPGGRKISAIFLVLSGLIVGLAAAIMGVGGGFLTFPIFVYGLGVSSMTTVGTDIFQIVFTAGYSALSQYAFYGFVFYTLAMGMLLGSLIGVQVGSLITKVVPGIMIRGFFALAVTAGFINRFFALPEKLQELGYIQITKSTGALLNTIGNCLFFIVIGGFTIWVFYVFFLNLSELKAEDYTISMRKKLKVRGVSMLLVFFAVLAVIFTPIFPGKVNGLDYMDNLFNMISKGSSYFIPAALTNSEKYAGKMIDVTVTLADEKQATDTAQLFKASGAEVSVSGKDLVVKGDLGRIMKASLEDADRMFQNNGKQLSDKYGMSAKQVLLNWWTAFKGMTKDLTTQKDFKQAKAIATIQTKALEPAYNYDGVDAGDYKANFFLLIAALIFYVIYTLWYGFGIMYLFEGFGLKIGH